MSRNPEKLSKLVLLSLSLLASPIMKSMAAETNELINSQENIAPDGQMLAYNENNMPYSPNGPLNYYQRQPQPQQIGNSGITSMAIGEEGGGSYGRPRFNQRPPQRGNNSPNNMQTLAYPSDAGIGYQPPQRLRQLPPGYNRPNNRVNVIQY